MAKKRSVSDTLTAAAEAMRDKSLAYPDAVEEFPWGEKAFKVKKKVFLFLFNGTYKGETFLNLTMKLPESHTSAVNLPFATATGYGLGKHGWVTSRFVPGDRVPLEIMFDWLDESFRAVAPAKVLEQFDGVVAPVVKKKSAKQVARKFKSARK